jgi:hypothetical protein
MSTIAILCTAGHPLVLPRDSASEIKVANATACGSRASMPESVSRFRLGLLTLALRKARVQIGNQQCGRRQAVFRDTQKRKDKQLAASRYLTADVLADRYFARLYARSTCTARQHQKDFKRAGGLDCLHTGSVSGLRGCSPQSLMLAKLEYLSRS